MENFDLERNSSNICNYTNDGVSNFTKNTSDLCKSNQENICGGYERYGHIVPVNIFIIFIGTFMAIMIVVLNGLLISILLRKNTVSAINILLSALGFCDACCAVLLFVPLMIGYLISSVPIDGNTITLESVPGTAFVNINYPFCVIFDWTLITLADWFHTMSMLITTILGLLKATVLMFPLKSRLFIKGKMARFICLATIIVCIAIYAPLAATKRFTGIGDNICCYENDFGNDYRKTFDWIVTMIYLLSFVILITSTIYICMTLTIKRSTIQRSENSKIQDRNRRAAIIVSIIVVIYLLSESISAFCYFSVTFNRSYDWCVFSFYQYQQLIMLLGFASNFFIYWFMSRDLRSQVYNYIRICFHVKNENMHSTNTKNSVT